MFKQQGQTADNSVNNPIYTTLDRFFQQYLTQRDVAGTLSFLSEQIYSIGTGEGEVAIGKKAFIRLLENEFSQLPASLPYVITDYTQKERFPGCWDCFFNMQTQISLPNGKHALYHMRLTAGLHQEGEAFIIDVLHASEASKYQEDGEFFPFQFLSQHKEPLSHETRYELMELIEQIMPGGIIGGYAEEGFPLYVANERLLHMAGYDHYEDFHADIEGLIINSIHADDRPYINAEMAKMLSPGDQYEIEYRMKKKDGSYMWVHDIGRRTVAADGRDAIISVLTDISQQIETQLFLEQAAISDPLTGIYNRKGGQIHIAETLKQVSDYFFLMVDLDNFKRINDLYGHQQGDHVLCLTANQLRKTFRKTDIICRLGGDEFAIFVPNCSDKEIVERKILQLINEYRIMMEIYWPKADSSLSIGGVYGNKKKDFSELYQLADEALYEVKHGQKGTFILNAIS